MIKKKYMFAGMMAFFAFLGVKDFHSVRQNSIYVNQKVLVGQGPNIEYQTNNLQDISSANPENFDNPQVGPNGILEGMQSTTINTKYGEMSIERVKNGFQCSNLSNPNAPVLYVGAVNKIYEVGDQADLKSLLSPTISNSSGQSIGGTIILPNVDTSQGNFGVKYVEAVGQNGAITIAPFIYNTVQFKNTINVNSENEIKALTLNDVLNGPSNDLKLYIANYEKGSNVITIGLSRGVASVQQAIPLTIAANSKAEVNTNNQSKINNNSTVVQKSNLQVPLLVRILLSEWTYIIIGIILIAIVAFFCFM